jgi:predicted N-acetyltransferase YhbS
MSSASQRSWGYFEAAGAASTLRSDALVLGDPAYYGRFGFTTEHAAGLQTPYDGPYLQGLALTDEGRRARGPVRYARPFAEL